MYDFTPMNVDRDQIVRCHNQTQFRQFYTKVDQIFLRITVKLQVYVWNENVIPVQGLFGGHFQ